jgi:hypothetical protein
MPEVHSLGVMVEIEGNMRTQKVDDQSIGSLGFPVQRLMFPSDFP